MSTTRPPSYDDHFVVPLEPSRRGAHRARTSPVASFLPVVAILTMVVAVLALGWVLFGEQLLGTLGGNTEAENSPSAQVTASAPAQGTATAAPTTTEPTVTVDRAVGVTVLNSTQTSGLARQAATALKGDGWTGAEFAFDYAEPRSTTVVYFAKSSQESTAQALVGDLGTGEAQLSPTNASNGILVVLGTDYTA